MPTRVARTGRKAPRAAKPPRAVKPSQPRRAARAPVAKALPKLLHRPSGTTTTCGAPHTGKAGHRNELAAPGGRRLPPRRHLPRAAGKAARRAVGSERTLGGLALARESGLGID